MTPPDASPSAIALTTRVDALPGVRRRDVEGLHALGLTNVGRLIDHLPSRHQFEAGEGSIADLAEGVIGTARGEVTATRVSGFGRKRRFEAVLMDDTGRLDLVWFNMAFLNDQIGPGMHLRVQGTPKARGPGLQMANPKHHRIDERDEPTPSASTDRLRPVYPANERIGPPRVGAIIEGVLDAALPLIEDHLDARTLETLEMPSLRDAYRMVHRPDDEDEVHEARRRLAYDELLFLQLGVRAAREQVRRAYRAPVIEVSTELDERIRGRLPFQLTPGQDGAVKQIARDLASDEPMNRLLQGDVGSGKTAVAVYAMLSAVAAGCQAALMAPTELLAEQHEASISALLEGSDVRPVLLTGSLNAADRAAVLARIASGDAPVVIGTHALLTESVRFARLGLCVIDEQHRFGVAQRATLREQASRSWDARADDGRPLTPHLLVMTATPIPRTLAMTAMGDLDLTTIAGRPPGRQSIRTRVVASTSRDKVYAWLEERIADGEQAYVVAPAIDPSPDTPAHAAATTLADDLANGALSSRRVGLMHGRMDRGERERVMGAFRAGTLDVLVATTVIEVGVDVPNATVMIIEQADRFGLAQLHQLRGRVGRGERASVCVLIGDPQTEDGTRRLDAIATESNGERIAEHDLAIRGWGDLIGARQSGLPPMRVADLATESGRALLDLARRDAIEWVGRSFDDWPPLLRRRFVKRAGALEALGDVS